MPNISTIPFLLMFAVVWRMTGGQVLAVVAFVSVFSAASVLDFGPMGVAPWLFALALGLGIRLLQGHKPYRLTLGTNRKALCLALVFFVYTAWSGVAYPLMFAGTPVVRTVAEEPLAWSTSNFSQLCYLGSAAVLYLLALAASRQELRNILNWYVRGCILASAFAMYQLLNAITHIPYPSEILYSNKAHVVYNAYQINGIWRLNATFCEASEMAGFLIVGIALTGWSLVTEPFKLTRLLSLLLMLTSILMTVSSVGYLCLGYLTVCGVILAIGYVVRQRRLSIPKVVFGLLVAMGMCGLFTLQPGARETVTKVIQSTLLEKRSSESYRNRTLTHDAALETLQNTYFMGAGWGSARASGLVYILLATVGVPGLLLFIGLLVSLLIPLFHSNPPEKQPPLADQFGQALLALSVLLLAMVIAGSEPVDPLLWILLGVVTVARSPIAKTAQAASKPSLSLANNTTLARTYA